MNKLNTLISQLLDKVNMKQENQGDKLEMLRKIEEKLNY